MIYRSSLLLLSMLLLTNCMLPNDVSIWMSASSSQNVYIGDPERGKILFQVGKDDAPPCSSCHRIGSGGFGPSLGPNLENIATTAGERVATMTAEIYIAESIINPDDFVVPGYRHKMFPEYQTLLSEQDIADIVAYLMSL